MSILNRIKNKFSLNYRKKRWPGLIEAYKQYLPVSSKTPIISLNEGNTPLIFSQSISNLIGNNTKVYLKYDGLNPTGSFKDRGMTMAISKAKEEGREAVICASTGNTSAAAAAYASRGGLKSYVLIPDGYVAQGKLAQALMYGAEIISIQGNFDKALEIVRRRIDEIGTNEPNILKRGNDRILVELPGLDDPMRIKSLLGKTANLTFRFVSNNTEDSFGTEKLKYEDSSEESTVSKRIILSGDNLLDAQPRMNNETNETVVSFTLDRVGAKRFGKATSTGIGKQLAIVLDGKIISAPVIRDTIASGSGQISGGFTFQSATDLALLLRSGALPAPLNIIEERTVGPDLGQDSIDAGMIALMIGFILVILFILIKYKIFGLITNIALVINLFLLIGVLTIFEATLTLPGIAGIILTVGMAVDANVLIFERIKEELKNEKNNLIAFDSGYTKSRTAILDANITTLLAAIILFFMGSGPIKGFSLTLGVGIFTTLFSVYFIARLLTVLYVAKNKQKEGLI